MLPALAVAGAVVPSGLGFGISGRHVHTAGAHDLAAHGGGAGVVGGAAALAGAQADVDADAAHIAGVFEDIFDLVVSVVACQCTSSPGQALHAAGAGVAGGIALGFAGAHRPLHGADHGVAQRHGHAALLGFKLGVLLHGVQAAGDADQKTGVEI